MRPPAYFMYFMVASASLSVLRLLLFSQSAPLASESLLKLRLISRNNKVTVGEAVELICQVEKLNMAMALTWTLQRPNSPQDTVVTVYSDGSISWSGVQHRYQLKVENKGNKVLHHLLVNGASPSEAGSYRCSVSVVKDGVYHRLPSSNQVAVIVANPGNPKFTSETCLHRIPDLVTHTGIMTHFCYFCYFYLFLSLYLTYQHLQTLSHQLPSLCISVTLLLYLPNLF